MKASSIHVVGLCRPLSAADCFRPESAACLNNHDTYNGVSFPTRSAQRRRNVFKNGGGGGGGGGATL